MVLHMRFSRAGWKERSPVSSGAHTADVVVALEHQHTEVDGGTDQHAHDQPQPRSGAGVVANETGDELHRSRP